jgi:hypothetical protein
LWGGDQTVQGALLVYPRGGCGNTSCHLFAHLLVCWISPKHVWSWHLVTQKRTHVFSV